MAHADGLWRRWLVTALAPLAVFAAGHVTLPGVDGDMLGQVTRAAGRARLAGFEQLSVVALGLLPALSGFLIVELLALAVPRWRPLRTGGPEGRASLRASATAVAIGVAAIQGWFVALWLESFSYRFLMFGEVVRDPGLAWRLVATVTLVAGACGLIALTRLVDRFGIGNGFAVLLASAALPYAADFVEHAYLGMDRGAFDLADVIGMLVRLGLVALGAWWILTVHRRVPGALRHPTSGLVPIATAASLLMLPVQLANLGLRVDAAPLAPGTRAYKWTNYVLVTLLCAGLSWLFQREARGTRRLWEGIGRTGAFLLAVLIVADGARFVLDVLVVIAAVAVTMDLVAEHRARAKLGELAPVWPVHQVARLDEHLAKLHAADIPVLARGEHYRTLLQFFGPYVPIELMVPVDRAADARAALEA